MPEHFQVNALAPNQKVSPLDSEAHDDPSPDDDPRPAAAFLIPQICAIFFFLFCLVHTIGIQF